MSSTDGYLVLSYERVHAMLDALTAANAGLLGVAEKVGGVALSTAEAIFDGDAADVPARLRPALGAVVAEVQATQAGIVAVLAELRAAREEHEASYDGGLTA